MRLQATGNVVTQQTSTRMRKGVLGRTRSVTRLKAHCCEAYPIGTLSRLGRMNDKILKAHRVLTPHIEANLVPFNRGRENVLEDADGPCKKYSERIPDCGADGQGQLYDFLGLRCHP